MSEYRTPEEDTIGGHSDLDDGDENGVPAESGDKTESAGAEQERVEPARQPD